MTTGSLGALGYIRWNWAHRFLSMWMEKNQLGSMLYHTGLTINLFSRLWFDFFLVYTYLIWLDFQPPNPYCPRSWIVWLDLYGPPTFILFFSTLMQWSLENNPLLLQFRYCWVSLDVRGNNLLNLRQNAKDFKLPHCLLGDYQSMV